MSDPEEFTCRCGHNSYYHCGLYLDGKCSASGCECQRFEPAPSKPDSLKPAEPAAPAEPLLNAPVSSHIPEEFSNSTGSVIAIVCPCGFATTYSNLGHVSSKMGWEHFERLHALHRERIAALEAERDAARKELKLYEEINEALEAKYEGCPHKPVYKHGGHPACGCSYDRLGDVCGLHAPALRQAQAELAATKEKLAKAEARMNSYESPDKTPMVICENARLVGNCIDDEIAALFADCGLTRREGHTEMPRIIAGMVQLAINREMAAIRALLSPKEGEAE